MWYWNPARRILARSSGPVSPVRAAAGGAPPRHGGRPRLGPKTQSPPDAPTAASSAFLSVVVRIQVFFLWPSVCFRSRRKFQCFSKGRGRSYTITFGSCASRKATRSSVPSWISASSAVAVGNPSRSRASRRASMNSARELKIATSDRVVGLDMSAVPFPLSRRQGLSRRSWTCRGDSERPELRGGRPAGGPLQERGVHLTAPRDVRSQRTKRARLQGSRLEGVSPTCNCGYGGPLVGR